MLFEKRGKSWRSVVKIYFRSRVFVHATLKRANQLINIVKYVNQDKKYERNHDSRWILLLYVFKYYFATDELFLYYMLRVKYIECNNESITIITCLRPQFLFFSFNGRF